MSHNNYADFEPLDETTIASLKKSSSVVPKQVETPEDKLNRAAVRGAEGFFGLPGDLASLGIGAANWATKKATGEGIPGAETIQNYLPGHENLRKGTNYVFGGKFEPENGEDSFWDKVASDFGSYLAPVGGAVKLGTAATRAFAGNVASEGAKHAGFGKTGQAVAKGITDFLSMFPGSFWSFGRKMNAGYKASEKAVPKGVTTPISTKDLLDYEKNLVQVGDPGTPAKQFLQDRVNAVGSKIVNDTIPVEEALALKKDFNQLWSLGEVPNEAKHSFGKLIDMLGDTLEKYGKVNKEFGQNFELAEDIFKGFRRMDKVSEFIVNNTNVQNLLKNGIKDIKAASIIGGLAFFSPQALTTKGALGASLFGAGQGVKYYNFWRNSKQAQKVYGDIIKGAAIKDTVNVIKNIKKFDKIAQHYDKKYENFEPI